MVDEIERGTAIGNFESQSSYVDLAKWNRGGSMNYLIRPDNWSSVAYLRPLQAPPSFDSVRREKKDLIRKRPKRRRKMALPFKMSKTDSIVCVFAEYASGPGWSNTPLWVIVSDGNRKLRQECIQTDEGSAELHRLYAISADVHAAMKSAVLRLKDGEK